MGSTDRRFARQPNLVVQISSIMCIGSSDCPEVGRSPALFKPRGAKEETFFATAGQAARSVARKMPTAPCRASRPGDQVRRSNRPQPTAARLTQPLAPRSTLYAQVPPQSLKSGIRKLVLRQKVSPKSVTLWANSGVSGMTREGGRGSFRSVETAL
jgi:hypothetical protein